MIWRLLNRLSCLFGLHDAVPDINAQYDRCRRCPARWRVI